MDQETIESADAASLDAGGEGRPSHLPMAIQSGILKSLGINLYTSIGKVIVEFIANAYDADATRVEITIPSDRIAEERTKAKAIADAAIAAAEAAASGQGTLMSAEVSQPAGHKALNLEALFETLPADVQVVIEDDGHGMTWEEVRDRFLPLNRQRRADAKGHEVLLTSPGGRYVMGRKGVGKLAGFGAALTVEIWTKRRGETSATIITLVDEDLNHAGSIHDVRVPVRYEDGLDADSQGTRVTLSRLKADATRDTMDKIRKVVTKSFHAIRPEDFSIEINGEQLRFELPDYEFVFPTDLTRDSIAAGARQEASVVVPGAGVLRYRYYVGFLQRSHAGGEERGATIYCNNRLAAGPALFGLPPGMHSFHSVDYMDCIIEADDLDRTDIDFVNTARNGIKEGNEVVSALLEGVVRAMRGAIAAHARFKKQETDRKLLEDRTARVIAATIETLPPKTRKAGKKLLQTLASRFEVGTPEFEELAPTIVNSINATEVLVALASHGTDAATIAQIMGQLRQLSEIEKQDSLKLYRARRGGIEKLEILYEKGKDNWNKRQFEKELHRLLKENPWLIRPEFSTYISSDQSINTTVTRLARELSVDQFAPIVNGDEPAADRPDLVFLMSDPMEEGPYTVKIVELKSPALALNIDHWRQLENYIADVRAWCEANLPHVVRINGYLIGTMPEPNPTKREERMLVDTYRDSGPTGPIQIIGLLELIRLARTVHVEAIKALERDLAGEEDETVEDVEDDDPITEDDEIWKADAAS
ncbi:ATP-binding protein [Sphingomonas sp.]|uniref:ATP-binding protein n=1 Tax=Sphingomonas sp. TaxID=28214 RepID=UPI0025D98FE0|nr:ATP-binding protein [Sphingomonas sp.]